MIQPRVASRQSQWLATVREKALLCVHLAVTRAALCAGRGTAFVRNPVPAPLLKKRRRAEYRLPPHSKFFANLRSIRMGIGIAVGIGVTFVFRNVYVYVNRFEVALQATEC